MDESFGPPPELSRARRLLFTAIYVALLAGVSLAGMELISRRLFRPQEIGVAGESEIVFDPKVGWRSRRHLSAVVPHGKYPLPIRVDINADGFRDGSWGEKLYRASQDGSKKILILGDSLVYGWANPVDGRVTEQVLARYRLAGRQVEVFNAGIPSYGPHNQLRLLPELLARVQPHEVVLVFCGNDYGDTALPYDYRHPVRVYQPFYDTQGRLLFNDPVPRRPSLAMRDTRLGGLRLWYAVDQFRYALEDRLYARRGIPTARTAPVHLFGDLLGLPELRARFPYVEKTLLAIYARMDELSRAAGARFTLQSSIVAQPPSFERVDALLRAKLEARGVHFLPCPEDELLFARWHPVLGDRHPNFVWAWIMANALYADLEGQPYSLDFAQMPQTRDIPSELDLSDDASCARFLSLDWYPAEPGGRRLAGGGSFFLRSTTRGAAQLEIVASATLPVHLIALTIDNRELCRFTVGTQVETHACAVDASASGPILFIHLLPETALDPSALPLIRNVRLKPSS
jgi:hypothetical protein